MHPAMTTRSPALVCGSVREGFYSEERAWAWAGSGRRAAQESRVLPHTAAGGLNNTPNVKCLINPRCLGELVKPSCGQGATLDTSPSPQPVVRALPSGGRVCGEGRGAGGRELEKTCIYSIAPQ